MRGLWRDEEQKGNDAGFENRRGAYLCKQMVCLQKARKNKGLERSLKTGIPEEIYDALEQEFHSQAGEE